MEVQTSIEIVANYFLSKIDMTNKKMQKMLYYAYSWYLVGYNDSENVNKVLFIEQPEAWIHGPVFPTIYDKYKIFGWNIIPKFTEEIDIDEELKTFLDEIISVFGKYDGDQLELMTHNEFPWKNARNNLDNTLPSNNKIQLKDIYNYYSAL